MEKFVLALLNFPISSAHMLAVVVLLMAAIAYASPAKSIKKEIPQSSGPSSLARKGYSYADLTRFCNAQSYNNFLLRGNKAGVITNVSPFDLCCLILLTIQDLSLLLWCLVEQRQAVPGEHGLAHQVRLFIHIQLIMVVRILGGTR